MPKTRLYLPVFITPTRHTDDNIINGDKRYVRSLDLKKKN